MGLMPHKINQKGFAVVESLLVIVILVLVGFVGYYVWHSNQQTKATLDAASKSATSSPSKIVAKAPTTTQKYFTIKEWGVEAPYNGSLVFEYNLAATTSPPAVASVEVKSPTTGDPQCENPSGGRIIRYRSTDEWLDEDGSDSGQTVAQFIQSDNAIPHSKVGDYYYIYLGPQSACSLTPAGQAIEQQAFNSLKALTAQFQKISH